MKIPVWLASIVVMALLSEQTWILYEVHQLDVRVSRIEFRLGIFASENQHEKVFQ